MFHMTGSKDSVSVAEMARQEQSAQSPKVLLQGQEARVARQVLSYEQEADASK